MPTPVLLPAAPAELLPLLILALVQGITEFLPISSDGHLTLTQLAMGFEGPHLAIDVALHLGTLGSVLVVFRNDLWGLVRRALAGEWREPALLAFASLPAAIVGLGLRSVIEPLFALGVAAAWGLLGTAAFLWAGERSRRRADGSGRPIDWRDALWIGCAQALAILPGVSRSGTTIATALMRGTEANQAARFSFLLSVPAISGAVLLEIPELVRSGGFSLDLTLAVGASFAVGIVALRVLLTFLARGAFVWCALYCAALGTVALFLF